MKAALGGRLRSVCAWYAALDGRHVSMLIYVNVELEGVDV